MRQEYLFKIDGSYSPETLPMERLALYVGALARLMGEPAQVHFETVRAGSAVLVARVDESAQPKVRDRVSSVRDGRATQDVCKAFGDLDELLRKDNATGELVGDAGAVVIPFPGRNRPEPLVFGPFTQEGSLDGQVIRIGGKDDTVHVQLRDGAVVHTGLWTTPDQARNLAQHFLGPVLRVHGTGRWLRVEDGGWKLDGFKIASFEVLDEAPLADVVAALRRVEGSHWGDVPDPVVELLNERHGDGAAH